VRGIDCAARKEEEEPLVNRFALRTALGSIALAGLLFPYALLAQASAAAPEIKAAPAAAESPAPAALPAPVAQKTKEYNPRQDWPWLDRFKEADLALAPPAAGEDRVVFMGDSITEGWKIEGADGSFPGKPYINRGISGQTTPQMVLRFRQDVIALKPKVVVILGGINDIAGNTGPMTLEETEGNLASMVELAVANHIRVVLCSVTPAFDFPWRPGMTPAGKVLALNAWIKAYAAEKGHVYVDYHSAMKDSRDGLPATLSADGVHPQPAGYALMTQLVEAGIEKALKAGNREQGAGNRPSGSMLF
jgi:lysophospholipase L1-like esterase